MSKTPSNYGCLSRSAKLKSAQKMYSCECGKAYLTYSSLYLHFKKQHHQKISTKSEIKNRLIRNYRGKVIQTYFYSGHADENACQPLELEEESYSGNKLRKEEDTNDNFKMNELKNMLHEFSNYLQPQKNDQGTTSQTEDTLLSFYCFISEKMKEGNGIHYTLSSFDLMQLPYFFNPFILEIVQREKCDLHEKRIKIKCQKLKSLAIWMKKMGYTNLEVECELIQKGSI